MPEGGLGQILGVASQQGAAVEDLAGDDLAGHGQAALALGGDGELGDAEQHVLFGEPVHRPVVPSAVTEEGDAHPAVTQLPDGRGRDLDRAEEADLVVISRAGQTLRTALGTVSTLGRSTQGVRVIRLAEKDTLASATIV